MSTFYEKLLLKANKDLFIIAEAGVNHNGDPDAALRLVDAAVEADCDAIKFQTFVTEKVYSAQRSLKPRYQDRTTDTTESEFETIKKLELKFEAFERIKAYCDAQNILFFSTPDEMDSAAFLVEIGVPLFKTASQDVTNIPFLRRLSELGLPIIFSTGACTFAELAEGVEAISSHTNELIVLHCLSAYPAPVDQLNLSVIPHLAGSFGFPVGFSDHTIGAEAACAAVALGARIFEKHLTLDRSMVGPDHQASLNPLEMRDYCHTLRLSLKAMGDGVKRIMPCEEDVRIAFRRFIVAARDLPRGSIISESDCVFKKVVSGISPKYLDLVVGRTLLQDVEIDSPLEWSMIGN